MENHYKTLGVEFGASLDEIKQSYRRLAMKWHPDKNLYNPMAENTFKIILRAYQVLSSSERAKYDIEYIQHFKLGKPSPTKKTTEEVKKKNYYFYEKAEFNNFAKETAGASQARSSKDNYDSSKVYNNPFGHQSPKPHTHTFNQNNKDSTTQQSFRKSSENTGTGKRTDSTQRTQKIRVKISLDFWSAIFGVSKSYHIKDPNSSEILTVDIKFPPGVSSGEIYVEKHSGREIEFHVEVEKDDYFFRVNLDIHSHFELPFSTAVSGGIIAYPYHTGNINLQIPIGFQNSQVIKIDGKGVCKAGKTGNLYLKGKIIIPMDINEQQKELIQKFQQIENFKGHPSLHHKFLSELWKKR